MYLFFSLDVPVACFTPSICSTCQSFGEIALVAGSRNVIVVSKGGKKRIGMLTELLKFNKFIFRSFWFEKCHVFCKKFNDRVDATTEDYMASQLWLGVTVISISISVDYLHTYTSRILKKKVTNSKRFFVLWVFWGIIIYFDRTFQGLHFCVKYEFFRYHIVIFMH